MRSRRSGCLLGKGGAVERRCLFAVGASHDRFSSRVLAEVSAATPTAALIAIPRDPGNAPCCKSHA